MRDPHSLDNGRSLDKPQANISISPLKYLTKVRISVLIGVKIIAVTRRQCMPLIDRGLYGKLTSKLLTSTAIVHSWALTPPDLTEVPFDSLGAYGNC